MRITQTHCTDETLANPDNLTKYKTAAEISQKALAAVSGMLGSWHLLLNDSVGTRLN